MDKEIKIVKAGNSKKLQLVVLIPLSPSQFEKMESHELISAINNIAKDLHVDWAIRINDECKTAEISSVHDDCITSQTQHDQEIIAIDFMSGVDKLELPQPEPECPNHEHESDKIETLKFVEKLLHDMNLPLDDNRHVCGALIIDTTTSPFCPELTGWGSMSYDLLKEMCKLYLKAHEQD